MESEVKSTESETMPDERALHRPPAHPRGIDARHRKDQGDSGDVGAKGRDSIEETVGHGKLLVQILALSVGYDRITATTGRQRYRARDERAHGGNEYSQTVTHRTSSAEVL